MKTKSFTVQRNYRISNDDQYAKALYSHEVIPDEGETVEEAALKAQKQMDNIFRTAYPHVEEHLNFFVVRQVKLPQEQIDYVQNTFKAASIPLGRLKEDGLPNEKINKGTIEEQIEACETVEELESFKLIAGMNEKLSYIYEQRKAKIEHKKLKELESKKQQA